MADPTKDFEELLASFRRHKVKSLIIGAHAVAFHARPRYTKDLDLFVEPTAENAARVLKALDEFGFSGLGLTENDFSTPGQVVQLGIAPNRVDIATRIDGITFDEAWRSRVEAAYGSETAWYIGREALLKNKRAAGRPQDLADVEALERAKG
jgi:hypothetical protein